MPADPAAAKAVFFEAAATDDPAARAALVAERCGEDAELLARVNALLAANDRAVAEEGTVSSAGRPEVVDGTLSVAGRADADATADRPGRDEVAGAVIGGKYTLVEPIGEGGMGTVWRAKQAEPVKRFVAVKLIKAGMDSKAVLARFDTERQALAVMDHPNIAKVLDGGLHDGRPYFAMELVKGVPITQFCDERKLTPAQRLELFVPVCQAIQHAHQKGVIHRDIKPSNVLVALYDDKPVPKVIDFGVAKATGSALTEHTLDTGFGAVVGTPQYMSPEQASLNNLDIDTRSDVYSLGILLYELLTGCPPFTKGDLEKKGLLEILRVVREEEPPRPSHKLSTADALPSLSANRGTEPKALTGLLRNELDWIVMKALEKDRTRRYDTANGFAADVQRYLSGEAVQAHPPSRGYRIKKFVRRNKAQVIAASLVFFALLGGMAGTTFGLIRAERSAEAERIAKLDSDEKKVLAEQAAAAERVAKVAAQEANELTARRLRQIELINRSVFDIFAEFDVRKLKAANEPVEHLLAKKLIEAGRKLDEKAIHDPLALASLRGRLGLTLLNLGEPEAAIGLFEKARETRTAMQGADHSETLTEMANLALAYRDADKLDLALSLHEETLGILKAKRGIEHLDTLTSMNNLALAYQEAGKPDQSVALLEETLGIEKAKLGADHNITLATVNNLAMGYLAVGKPERAVPLLMETLKLRQATLGADHPETLTVMNNLAQAYQAAGKLDLALPLFEESLKFAKAKLGADHPDTLAMMQNLAKAYQAASKPDLALPHYDEVLRLRKAKLAADHSLTLVSTTNLAECYWRLRQFDKSVPLYEGLLPLVEKKLGRNHPHTLTTVANLGVNYKDSGRLVEAIPLLEEAHRASVNHPSIRWVGGQLLDAYVKAGKTAEAAKLAHVQVDDARKQLPKDSPQLAGQLAVLGLGLLELRAFTEAEPLLRECLAIREKAVPDAWTTFNTQSMLGGALLGQKKYADAEPQLLAGYEGMKQREKSIPPQGAIRIPEALDRLIELHTATNKPDEAKKYRELRAKYPAAPPPR